MTIAAFVAMLNDRGLADVFFAWLVWSLKGTVLLLLAWIATLGLRGGSAAVRHLVWSSALAGMVLLPAFARIVPVIHVAWLSDAVASVGVAREAPSVAPIAAAQPMIPQPTGRVEPPAPTPSRTVQSAPSPIKELTFKISNSTLPRPSPGLLVSIAWVVGAGLLLLRAFAGVLRLSVWARRAQSVDDAEWLSLAQRLARAMQIGRPVTLLQSDRACVPMTWGVIYPRILLPAEADSWLANRRMIVLLHELAHIKRLDTLTQLLAQVSTALFWFHPAVWFASREMRREREHACDDFVLDAGARASDYAHSLLQIARPLVSRAPAAAALAMARKSELEGRLLAILDPRIDRRPASRARLVIASAGLIVLAIPLAAVSPSRTATAAQTRPTLIITHTADTSLRALIPVPTVGATPSAVAPHENSPVAAPGAATTPAPSFAPAPAAVFPPPTVAGEKPAWARLNMVVRVAKRTPDVETLIAVTRAATKMTSDHEKAEVLLSVARHYVRNDELRTAYFDAVLSMHNDYDRTRALEPVLMKDTLPASASPQLLRIAQAMTSDNLRGSLVLHLATGNPSMRSALISLAGSLRTDYERGRAITALTRGGDLSAEDALRLIAIAKSMSGSTDKANSLLAIAGSRSLDTPELRRAYLAAAETITSAFDYRRAVVRVIE